MKYLIFGQGQRQLNKTAVYSLSFIYFFISLTTETQQQPLGILIPTDVCVDVKRSELAVLWWPSG